MVSPNTKGLLKGGATGEIENNGIIPEYQDGWYNASAALNKSLENWWDVFHLDYLRHSIGWTIALAIAYTVIFIVGVFGNSMVILVVVLRPQMRTVTNMFIMNLAVADLFVIVFCVPATLMSNVFIPWILGSVMCKGVAYVQGVSVCASAYSLVAISLDRCKAIYRPLGRSQGLSKSQALLTICFIWAIALLLIFPWAVVFTVVKSENDGFSYCVENWGNKQHGKIYFLLANLFSCYLLPSVLITLANITIWCHVSHRKVPQDSASAGIIRTLHRRTRHGVRRMLSIVTLTFLVSWLPLYVLVTFAKFSKNMNNFEADIFHIALPCAQWLGSCSSSINPVLYAFLNGKFREMFQSLIPRCCLPFRNNGKSLQTRTNRSTNYSFIGRGNSGTTSYTTTILPAEGSPRGRNNSWHQSPRLQQHTAFNRNDVGQSSRRSVIARHFPNDSDPPEVPCHRPSNCIKSTTSILLTGKRCSAAADSKYQVTYV